MQSPLFTSLRSFFAAAFLAISMLVFPAVVKASPFQNGDFGAGLTGWTLVNSGGDGLGGAGVIFNSNQANGSGVLSQTFDTTIGQRYSVRFDYGAYLGVASGYSQQLQVEVRDGASASSGAETIESGSGSLAGVNSGSSLPQNGSIVTVADTDTSNAAYSMVSFSFTAQSATSTLVFTDQTGGAGQFTDGSLGHVRVTARGLGPGDLDPTFGGTGILTADIFNHGDDHAFGVAVQSDGRIVAAGYAHNGSNYDFTLLRYQANGSLDPGFGAGGKVTTDFGGVNALGFAVALQSDGKIVVAGTAGGDFALARYNFDGSLDTSFNGSGKVTTDIGSGSGDDAHSVVVESDGKIVVAGISNNSFYDIAVARYNPDGSLDTSFNGSGKVTTSSDAGYNHRCSAAVQGDGKIVVASPFNNGGSYDITVLRYNTDGTPDTSFNSTGQLITAIGSSEIAACSVAVQSNGRIVVAGTSGTNPSQQFAVLRYTAGGMPDTSFNGTGMVTTAIGTGVSDGPSIALQSDGKIVLAGTTSNGFYADFAVLRYNVDGTLDPSFNGSGKVETDVGGGGLGYSVALQSDGGIVVAGDHFNGDFDFALVRYKADGTIDRTFGAGKVTTAIGSGDEKGQSMAVQSDGKILVSGYFYNGSNNDFAVVRYNADGSLDPSFGSGGKVTTAIGSGDDDGRSVAIQNDGKIVVAGTSINGGTGSFAVARYNSNGTLDPSFNGTGTVITAVGDDATGYSLVLQSDGKIVVAGKSFNGSNTDFAVVRYNADGMLDLTFNGTGKVITDFGGGNDFGNYVTVQSDGKILITGGAIDGIGNSELALVRYTANGILDASFNGTGKVATTLGTATGAIGNNVVVRSDGRIFVAGHFDNGSDFDFVLLSYTASGLLDPTFNGTGIAITPIGSGDDLAYGLAVQNDSKVVVGGYSYNGSDFDFALVRYNPAGMLDTSLNGTGKVSVGFGSGNDYGVDLALQGDGKIVMAGFALVGTTQAFAVVRFLGGPEPSVVSLAASGVQSMQAILSASVNANGLDTQVHFEYGTDPTLTVASSTNDFDIGSGMNALPEDQPATGLTPNATYYYRVVATNSAGTSYGSILSFTTLPSAPAVTTIAADQVHAYSARLRGTVDAFGQATVGSFKYGTDPALNGATTTSNVNLGSGQGAVPLGQVVTGLEPGRTYYFRALATNGTGTTGGNVLSFTTAAVPGDASAAFNPDVDNTVFSSAVQPDGKIVIGGAFGLVGGVSRDSLARLNRDGSLDTAFDVDTDGTVFSTAVQPDGRILVGGSFTHVNGMAANCLARLNADGTLDPGFTVALDAQISSLAVQADGKIVIAGGFDTVNGATHHHIARLNADGSLDPAFNADADVNVSGVSLQPDGMILLAGSFTTVNNTTRFYFARLQADGSLDTSFTPTTDGAGLCTAVQADGKIVISGGFALAGGMTHHGLARLNADGSLDGTFSPDVDNDVRSVVIQSDGQIIIGGFFSMVAGTPRSRLARLQTDGTLDMNFNPGADADVFSTALLQDGRIMVGGNFANIGGTARTGLALLENVPASQSFKATSAARVEWLRGGSSPETQAVGFELSIDGGQNWTPLGAGTRIAGGWELTGLNLPAAGTLRARARVSSGIYNGSSGLAETVTVFPVVEPGFNPGASSTVFSTAVQPDGKLVIVGAFTTVGGVTRNNLARLNPDGSLDVGFDPAAEPAGIGTVFTALVQADGKVFVGGGFSTIDGVTRNSVARLNADGTLDADFDASIPMGSSAVYAAMQGDGRIVIAGSFHTVGGLTRDNLARLNSDGTADSGFVDPMLSAIPYTTAVQADGLILVGGRFLSVGGMTRHNLARLNADGTLDAGFDPDVNNDVFCLAVQADGKIVVGGFFTAVGGVARHKIARLNVDGSLDANFNPDVQGQVNSLAVQADGKIILVGFFTTVNGVARNSIARLNVDGSLDAGFDPDAGAGILTGVTLQADGKMVIVGAFGTLGGVLRGNIARLNNEAATQNLTVPNVSRVQWLRGGTSPETLAVTFEQSTDGGTNWTLLGNGTRIGGGWELSGLSLPGSGQIRARARTTGGYNNGSSGLVEAIAPFDFATTGAATVITSTGANVGGSVNPNGLPTQAFFQYGTDPALVGASSTASASAGSGTSPVLSTGGAGEPHPRHDLLLPHRRDE